jgi:LIVCS family branched-chain amino acid:cation transporter
VQCPVWLSLFCFIVSPVGLPILGVTAIAKAGSFRQLSNRVHPKIVTFFPGLGIP